MGSSLEEKEVMVVGGTGSIGSAVVRLLREQKYRVSVVSRGLRAAMAGSDTAEPRSRRNTFLCDVTREEDVRKCFLRHVAQESRKLAGIVYAVGKCPPGGLDKEISTPLCELNSQRLREELDRHVIGLHNIMRHYHPALQDGGSIVVVSSAITRIMDNDCPPWLHAGHYATAKAAQDELVRWWRRDPSIKKKGILIHRLAPAAVDTPFHHESAHQPHTMLSIDEVAHRVVAAMRSSFVIDKVILPWPPIEPE